MQLILIRGLPGSGKSTLAKTIQAGILSSAHIETDKYFMRSGQYDFRKEELHLAHIWAQDWAEQELSNGYDVIVSNTFSMMWEMRPYIKMAKKYHAQLTVLTCEGQYGNVHNVPDEVIQKMKARWQPYVND